MSLDSRLSDAIMLAGGYRDDAYINAGILNNEVAGEVSAMGAEFAYKKMLESILTNSLPNMGELLSLLEELKPMISKRVIANFDLDLICDNPDLDTFLNDGDIISIPQITEQVYVYGAVSSPGSIRFRSRATLEDYIKLKGGLVENADQKHIFIISPNGESTPSRYRKLSLFGQKSNQTIEPGSIILVTPELGLTRVMAASIWAPLISSFALTLASVSSLDK
jgi:protein involved in polysaccharide export with SLBB domain